MSRPQMTKILSTQVIKGGQGKTFYAYHLAWFFGNMFPNLRVLLIDADNSENGSAGRWVNARKEAGLSIPFAFKKTSAIKSILKNADQFDIIIFDFGGSSHNMADQVLVQKAADLVIIPMMVGMASDAQVIELRETLVKRGVNHKIIVSNIFQTHDASETKREFEELGYSVINTLPRIRGSAARAYKQGKTVPELISNKRATDLINMFFGGKYKKAEIKDNEQSTAEVLAVLKEIKEDLEL